MSGDKGLQIYRNERDQLHHVRPHRLQDPCDIEGLTLTRALFGVEDHKGVRERLSESIEEALNRLAQQCLPSCMTEGEQNSLLYGAGYQWL